MRTLIDVAEMKKQSAANARFFNTEYTETYRRNMQLYEAGVWYAEARYKDIMTDLLNWVNAYYYQPYDRSGYCDMIGNSIEPSELITKYIDHCNESSNNEKPK